MMQGNSYSICSVARVMINSEVIHSRRGDCDRISESFEHLGVWAPCEDILEQLSVATD